MWIFDGKKILLINSHLWKENVIQSKKKKNKKNDCIKILLNYNQAVNHEQVLFCAKQEFHSLLHQSLPLLPPKNDEVGFSFILYRLLIMELQDRNYSWAVLIYIECLHASKVNTCSQSERLQVKRHHYQSGSVFNPNNCSRRRQLPNSI